MANAPLDKQAQITEDKVRFFGSELQQILTDHVAGWSVLAGGFGYYSQVIASLLVHCKDYRGLEDHARSYLDKNRRMLLAQPPRSLLDRLRRFLAVKLLTENSEHSLSPRDVEQIRQQLEQLASIGLLQSSSQIEHRVSQAISTFEIPLTERQTIRVLGIPTRNRSKKLLESLQSYLVNFEGSERKVQSHIMDDSDSDHQSANMAEEVEKLCKSYDAPLLWIDRTGRQSIARNLAKASGAPLEIVEFGLLGDPRCANRTGSVRNTLMLLSAGEPSVQVDDDIICQIRPSPWQTEGIGLVSNRECSQYEFMNHSQRQALGSPTAPVDFFGLHERLLGRHPADLLQNNSSLDTSQLDESLLEKIGNSHTRIRTTFSGVYGDSGMFRHWQRLGFDRASFDALVENPDRYRQNLRTRELFRTSDREKIVDSPFCMAGVVGLDTTSLLPPFMPVGRNQDGVMGILLHMNFPYALKGFSPWALLHDPPNREAHVDLSHALSVGPWRVNDILPALLWSQNQDSFGLDAAENLRQTGRFLINITARSPLHFQAIARKACWKMINSQIQFLQRRLDERYDAPEYWRSDVQVVLSNMQELLTSKDLGIPYELPGGEAERLSLFRKIIERYGQLLIHWPSIWQAASEISSDAHHLAIERDGLSASGPSQTHTEPPSIKNDRRNTAILTTVWKREALTRLHFENIAALDRKVFVGVSEEWARKLCEEFGFEYIYTQNDPLGRKKNRVIEHALAQPEWTHLMELGSDDFVDKQAFTTYEDIDVDHYGVTTIYFAHPETRRAKLFTYNNNFPAVFGAGRVLSRKAIEMAAPLWKDDANKSMDVLSTHRLKSAGFKPLNVETDPFIIDIKTGVNLWSYDHFEGEPVEYESILERFGLSAELLHERLALDPVATGEWESQ